MQNNQHVNANGLLLGNKTKRKAITLDANIKSLNPEITRARTSSVTNEKIIIRLLVGLGGKAIKKNRNPPKCYRSLLQCLKRRAV